MAQFLDVGMARRKATYQYQTGPSIKKTNFTLRYDFVYPKKQTLNQNTQMENQTKTKPHPILDPGFYSTLVFCYSERE